MIMLTGLDFTTFFIEDLRIESVTRLCITLIKAEKGLLNFKLGSPIVSCTFGSILSTYLKCAPPLN